RADPELFRATSYLVVDLTDPADEAAGIAWWEELTSRDSEGIVIEPLSFIRRGSRGLAQPAVRWRGREQGQYHDAHTVIRHPELSLRFASWSADSMRRVDPFPRVSACQEIAG